MNQEEYEAQLTDDQKKIYQYVKKGVITQEDFDKEKDDPEAIMNIMIWIAAAELMRDLGK